MSARIRIILVTLCASAAALLAPAVGHASEIVDRATSRESLQADARGNALVTYRARGRTHRVIYWGPTTAVRSNKSTLRFRYDRSGGWRSRKTVRNSCGRYRGPKLPLVVRACTARDGTHWVLQKWARMAPNYGGNPETFTKELRLSHFKANVAPAQLSVLPNWSWGGRYFHIAATLRYNNQPWYAINFQDNGAVTDQIGRNVTIDSLNSDMGSGWRRVNAILTHRPSGQMCFGFTPKKDPYGQTEKSGYSSSNLYRLRVPGPGVSPDVELVFQGLRVSDYDRAADQAVNNRIHGLLGSWTGRHNCRSIN